MPRSIRQLRRSSIRTHRAGGWADLWTCLWADLQAQLWAQPSIACALLLLGTLLTPSATSAAEFKPVSYSSRGQTASQSLQTLSVATGVPMHLGPDVLARGGDQTPLFLELRGAKFAVTAEAIAQGLGTWWLMTLQQRLRFSDSVTVPLGP